MLREPERQALAQLSVFRGVFDRIAIQTVARTSVTLLAALIHTSLLRHMGLGVKALGQRHAAYDLDLLTSQEPALYRATPQTAAATCRYAADNVRQAWNWAVEHNAWGAIGCLPALRQYARLDRLFYENAPRSPPQNASMALSLLALGDALYESSYEEAGPRSRAFILAIRFHLLWPFMAASREPERSQRA